MGDILRREARAVAIAFMTLTRLPVPSVADFDKTAPHAPRYFPLVGLGIGALSAAVWYLSAQVLPVQAAAILAVCASVLVTGGLHEDGLSDIADGLGAPVGNDRALEIMRDSRIGAFGALALILIVLGQVSVLAALDPVVGVAALVAGHAFSRAAIVQIMWQCPYARTKGAAAPFHSTGLRDWVFAAALSAGVAGALLGPVVGMLMLATATAIALGAVRVFRRRLGGYTGDGLGAVQQMSHFGTMCAAAGALG